MRAASLGFDIGTSRVRCLVADARTGGCLGAGDAALRSGRDGVLEDPANPLVSRQAPGGLFHRDDRRRARCGRERPRRNSGRD